MKTTIKVRDYQGESGGQEILARVVVPQGTLDLMSLADNKGAIADDLAKGPAKELHETVKAVLSGKDRK